MDTESIHYYRRPEDPGESAEIVTLSVVEIDDLADAGLRNALRRQHEHRDDPNHAHIVYAHSDGTFSHGLRIPKRPIFTDEELANA